MHAFEAGYDPVLELGKYHLRKKKSALPELDPSDPAGGSTSRNDDDDSEDEKEEDEIPTHILRAEQALVDRIVRGEETGSYWLIIGSKGTGKGTMIVE